MHLYDQLKTALQSQIEMHQLGGQSISIRCQTLSAEAAIGNPEHDDYPIVKGKEKMVEADFRGAKGQAFTDSFENADCRVNELFRMPLDSNRQRATFVAGLNAIYRFLGLCDQTIHCRDNEPIECAQYLGQTIAPDNRVLLVGHQPRFLEFLAANYPVRAVDGDPDNIGADRFGVPIEPPSATDEAIEWCDLIFATGSTLVNATIGHFLEQKKPVLFYGVTIAGAATILDIAKYCPCGH